MSPDGVAWTKKTATGTLMLFRVKKMAAHARSDNKTTSLRFDGSMIPTKCEAFRTSPCHFVMTQRSGEVIPSFVKKLPF
ncbi:MAG: hypothetical protein Q4G70_00570 [Pseudomonadota bacterium]|nr:hypothetical protein [Pseudomonadota bacterium]